MRKKIEIPKEYNDRILTLLSNLSLKTKGWKRFLKRWKIADEPLRVDAKNIMEEILRVQYQQDAFYAFLEANSKRKQIKPRIG